MDVDDDSFNLEAYLEATMPQKKLRYGVEQNHNTIFRKINFSAGKRGHTNNSRLINSCQ